MLVPASPPHTSAVEKVSGAVSNTLSGSVVKCMYLVQQVLGIYPGDLAGVVYSMTADVGYTALIAGMATVRTVEQNCEFLGLDSPYPTTLHAEDFVSGIGTAINLSAYGRPSEWPAYETMLEQNSKDVVDLVLTTCTDATSIVWTPTRVVAIAGVLTRTIWTMTCKTPRGPVQFSLSYQILNTDALVEPMPLWTSDGPALTGPIPQTVVVPMGGVTAAVEAITNQDVEVGVNDNAAVYSVKAKVVAT
jgi:hypothetical protein